MGKYSRPSRTKKLEKLTAQVEAGATAPQLQKQVKEIMKTKSNKLPTVAEVVEIQKNQIKPEILEKANRVAGLDPALPGAEKTVKTLSIGKTIEEISGMNIYRKMQTVRSVIAKMDLKQSGVNEDKGFNYFQLGDYLPEINILGEEIGLMTHFNMNSEKGVLKVFNIDNPEQFIEWELPVGDLLMQDEDGGQAEGIQIMKGKSTYMRRALFENAFEISVKDSVDSKGKEPAKPEDKLDARDVQALEEASDVEHLNTISQNIRNRKGFNKQQALLKAYTDIKAKLEKK